MWAHVDTMFRIGVSNMFGHAAHRMLWPFKERSDVGYRCQSNLFVIRPKIILWICRFMSSRHVFYWFKLGRLRFFDFFDRCAFPNLHTTKRFHWSVIQTCYKKGHMVDDMRRFPKFKPFENMNRHVSLEQVPQKKFLCLSSSNFYIYSFCRSVLDGWHSTYNSLNTCSSGNRHFTAWPINFGRDSE